MNAISGRFDNSVSARGLFLCGALTLPAFLFQQDLGIRTIQVLLAVSLCFLTGRKVRIPTFVVLCAGIIAFNLIVPSGRVLLTVIGLPMTDGALRGGVVKATAVAGMIALSKLSIRADLELPGRLGGLIGRCLMYFELIMGNRKKIRREAIFESIDEVLEEAYGAREDDVPVTRAQVKTTLPGLMFLALFVFLNWVALFFPIATPSIFWHR